MAAWNMARSFTETEKENIRKRLLDACRQSWTQYGYKKTSVDELCQQAGISKGAFYLFFESKEALFCDVLCSDIVTACFVVHGHNKIQGRPDIRNQQLIAVYQCNFRIILPGIR